jgi:uncharacterized membrane protein YqgA involved in biofilm formation
MMTQTSVSNRKKYAGWPIATFINMIAVTIGSLLGIWLAQLFPANIEAIIFQAIGLSTLIIGIKMCLRMPEGYLLVFIFSLIIGGVTGELLGVQTGMQAVGDQVKALVGVEDSRFTEGLVTAFLLFCVGSVTIVGAIEEGIKGKRELLLIKSLLDGITSVAFAATYGIGVLFSIFPMLLFQGGLTVLASRLQRFFSDKVINMLSSVGGVLIIAVGINMLEIGQINIENLLPALFWVLILTATYDRFFARPTG